MKIKPVVPRAQAHHDIEGIVARYLSEEAANAALDFVDELEKAYRHIGRNPGTGSARYGHALDLPGLRSWPLTRFPHLVFYFERVDHIDVWRVLHSARDIPAWMQAPNEGT